MRIIGGEYKGRKLKMPKTVAIRPTQDRVREAVFNIIREKVPGSNVLDLYAGSGAFGIEALSRGGLLAIFVDNNITCIKTIKSNLLLLGNRAEFSQLFKLDALKSISKFEEEDRKFDIIFLDPPYYKSPFDKLRAIRRAMSPVESLAKNSLIKIDACDILSHHGFIIAEHFKKDVMPEKLTNITLFKQRRYGDTVVSFYVRHG